jgi:hypothetical protein
MKDMMKRVLLMMMLMFTLGMSAQTIVERVALQATLNGKIPVRVAFEVDAEKTAAGEIYYPKAKNPAPILIVGYKMPDGDYYLREFNSKGEVTGIVHVERKAGKFSGYWTNTRTEEGLRFTNLRTIAFPKACGGKLLPEDPAHIGREYRYSFYHTGMKEMMGGTATFKGAGKNRIHFDISNVPGNIAEGKSEQGRPAVLHGNQFVYNNINECGYGFKAIFYKQFVVFETTSDYGTTTDCFGAHTTFDGVYIKVKE